MPKQAKPIPNFRGLPILTACSVLALTSLPSAAQEKDSLNACAQINAAEQRLACYDRLSGLSAEETSTEEIGNKLPSQVESSSVEQNTRIDMANTAPDTREETPPLDSFGRDSHPVQARIERNDKGFELVDTVIDLRQYHHARLEIRLSGGQLWRQTAARRFHLNEGEEVRIYPSDFGTDYRLSAKERSGFIQVQRIE